MPRRRSANPKKSKFDWSGNSYPQYDPAKEGYGSADEWSSMFNVRMGFEEARDVKSKSKRTWGTDWTVVSDISGVHVDENSLWAEVKRAFYKASMNCHPDRAVQNNMCVAVAEETFKDLTAAYVMLEDIYRSKGRLN